MISSFGLFGLRSGRYYFSSTNAGVCPSLPPVFTLLAVRRPPAIFGRVSPCPVDPIYCQVILVPVRGRPHFELKKTFCPLVAYGNSCTTVPVKARNILVPAPALHVLPYPIKPGLLAGCERRSTVFEIYASDDLVSVTTAANHQPLPKGRCLDCLFFSAIAPAKPPGMYPPVRSRADDRQAAKSLPHKINLSWHGHAPRAEPCRSRKRPV